MRIVLLGQAAFAAAVLKKLLENNGEDVIAVYTPTDKSGDVVEEAANTFKVPVFRPPKMADSQVIDNFIKLKADLAIMAFVTEIIPLAVLRNPKLGTIQYHPSLLPRHRGGSSLNWTIIQGDVKTGVTIFWPDEGIDTGPILLQKEADIYPTDTQGSLYFDKLFPLGVAALAEAVDLIEQGIALRIPQDEAQATYEPLFTESDAVIDWSLPATKIFDLIRGSNPRPGASTSFRGEQLKIFDSELVVENSGGTHGQVIDINEESFTTAAMEEAIRVRRVQHGTSPKITAKEFIQLVGLEKGDHLK
ncbi:MAG: methionyl-tRNA formyltransferase [Dehalococcoidales bacterium]|jgi:methionyl-tRNA formyltransferase|nr:methionyl-tRNA formyltransferase [Dehalococcoidales bacterium]|tara:strand:- start:2497 stop:3408 length:912 start_codon:yes stop_codon:yes gene_type:complete